MFFSFIQTNDDVINNFNVTNQKYHLSLIVFISVAGYQIWACNAK